MAWYDSHIHLSDSQYDAGMEHTLNCMEALDIRACCVSTNNEDSARTLDLARSSDRILPFVGIHPEFAGDDLGHMVDLVTRNPDRIAGIGEIGLDPGYGRMERQLEVFEDQLVLAEELDLPVSIHSRKSLAQVFDVMESHKCRTLLHWFDGSKRDLAIAMDMGFFVSYGPVTVYANDKQALLSRTDESRILVETDGPVRFSRCFESMPAQPEFVSSVMYCAAGVLEKSFDEMSHMLERNFHSYMGWPAP